MDKAKEREKMIGLIINAKRTDPETGSFTEWLADFLLDHGVTVPADDVPGARCLQENRCPAPAFRVGDRAWKANDAYVFEVDVRRLIYDCGRTSFDDDDIGETVFRTKDEAEAAMEKMKEAPHPTSDLLDSIYPVDPENDGSDGCTVVAAPLTLTSEELEAMLDKIPAADVAPVIHARWIHLGGDEWACSSCGFGIHTDGSWEKPPAKHCQDCGAKMDKED